MTASSSPSSTPAWTIPDRATVADMIVWYTSPTVRAELIATSWSTMPTPLDGLVEETIGLLETWQPTTPYQWEVVAAGRTVEWLVWQTALGADEAWAAAYTDIEMTEPWAIRLETLPRYHQPPIALTHPD